VGGPFVVHRQGVSVGRGVDVWLVGGHALLSAAAAGHAAGGGRRHPGSGGGRTERVGARGGGTVVTALLQVPARTAGRRRSGTGVTASARRPPNRRSWSTRAVSSARYSRPMTVLTRGSRPRRGGRRPGWVLLTALLVLAIAASSALVFTNRVELLKLAVILSLWAAVAAAFVSVIYRRQSDIDQAKARDLKLVYDLQLDREISARREYELTLETQLRRELAAELQAQQSDEVAALRAELAALRPNLEILFDTDLAHRPALETERTTVRAYSDWAREEPAGRLVASRYDATGPEDGDDDSAIIDVAAEPHSPEGDWAPVHDTAGG